MISCRAIRFMHCQSTLNAANESTKLIRFCLEMEFLHYLRRILCILERKTKLVRVVGIGIFGISICEVGIFGGNSKLEFYLDIMVESFEECPTRLLRRQNILAGRAS
jgi:hypothetical protein